MIHKGYLIENGKIFDTKISSYKLNKKIVGDNVLFTFEPNGYRRLYRFEPLLDKFAPEKACEILDYNTSLRKLRKKYDIIQTENLKYIPHWSVIYNYPPSFLTPKKFQLYKLCQKMKGLLD